MPKGAPSLNSINSTGSLNSLGGRELACPLVRPPLTPRKFLCQLILIITFEIYNFNELFLYPDGISSYPWTHPRASDSSFI